MSAAVARSRASALRVFAPFAFGYFLSYLFRSVNAVIAPDLSRDPGVGAGDLGLLTSTFFLAFAIAQLPLGIVLDRFGPRRTEAALLIVAALGAFVFATADGLAMLIVGRALVGFGVSACLMAAFKAYVEWFPRERLPLVNGWQMAAGGLGAMAATSPVAALVAATDWRFVFCSLGALSLVAAALVFIVVPRDRENRTETNAPMGAQLEGLSEIFASPLFWRVAPMTIASQASFLSIQGLWAGPWLRDVAGLDDGAVAHTLLIIAAAMIAGFLVMGLAAERLSRLGVPPLIVAAAGMTMFMLTLSLIVFTRSGSAWPWIAFGFFGTSGILPYAGLSQRFAVALAGRLNTALNVFVFVAAFAAQWGIGVVVAAGPRTPTGSAAAGGYQGAFAIMAGLLALTLAWFALFRWVRIRVG